MWKIFDYTESKYFYTVICVYIMQYHWSHTEFEFEFENVFGYLFYVQETKIGKLIIIKQFTLRAHKKILSHSIFSQPTLPWDGGDHHSIYFSRRRCFTSLEPSPQVIKTNRYPKLNIISISKIKKHQWDTTGSTGGNIFETAPMF